MQVYLVCLGKGTWDPKQENEVLPEQATSSPRPRPTSFEYTRNWVSDDGSNWEKVSKYRSTTRFMKPVGAKSDSMDNVTPPAMQAPRPTKYISPVHGHLWPFNPNNGHLPTRTPIQGVYSMEGTFLWAVGLFGSVENGAVVLAMLCSKKIYKPLHILVGGLGFTDLFISMIYIPSYTYFLLERENTVNLSSPKVPGEGRSSDVALTSSWSFCNVARAIFLEVASVTLSFKCLIAVYLLVMTRRKKTASLIFSTTNTVLLVILIWVINVFLLFAPNFSGYSAIDFYPNPFLCDSVPNSRPPTSRVHLAYTLASLGFHLVELLVTMCCFVGVHLAIRHGQSIWSQNSGTSGNSQEAKTQYIRASKTTIFIFVTFCVCWLPLYVGNIVDPLHEMLPQGVHRVLLDLLLLKSAINPLIYIYGLRSLRHEIKLCCMCRCRSENPNTALKIQPSSTIVSKSKSTKAADL